MRLTMIALVASITTTAHAQGIGAPDPSYAPRGVNPNIMAPERPRGASRQPPIAVTPLEPLSTKPPPPMMPAPPAPIQREPNPLIEWCKQEANAKAPLCRNVGSPRVQR